MAQKLLTVALSFMALYAVTLCSLTLLADAKVQSSLEVRRGSTFVFDGQQQTMQTCSQALAASQIRLGPLKDCYAWLESSGFFDLFKGSLSQMTKEERWRLIKEENEWKNTLVMWMFPQSVQDFVPHFAQSWIRNYLLCMAVYLGVGGLWCWYTYICFGHLLFKPGNIPGMPDILEQIKVSFKSIPLYSMLPTVTEWAAESGWTNAYPRIENVGLGWHIIYFILYMASVEFGVYWNHRNLHDIKWAYKILHWDHHKYNKEHTLSPFAGDLRRLAAIVFLTVVVPNAAAGLAFHPIDGIIQAIPYSWTLLYCPMHFLTHEMMLFFSGIWTTNIHDCIHGKVMPIMGAGYHTIHHTIYRENYGFYTIYMDWLFGTLYSPEEYEANDGKIKRS